ncbi:MAG: winged helix-turn-helix domain-containing protein [Lachnospiraceae bacterium]|nr:winged helix-turn-helix domain-containing protein [Lachnospiraceae bacterium]
MDEPKEDLLTGKIIRLLRDNPHATYDDLVTELGVSRSTIKRAMGNLVADGHIVRVGGKRYGHWKIND